MSLHDQVICGDSREVLAGMETASVDAIVTDPPYALTQMSRGGSPRSNDPTEPYGRHRLADKGFMGQQWDNGKVAHDPAFWAEVLRVAKPGAHLVAFGGTRTAHRLACAIEDAGWEIRDSLYWLHGQGFPKSLDVSKAIDKKAGAEREVVGRRTDRAATPVQDIRGGRYIGGQNGAMDCSAITAPTTDAAKQWEGWGTALKPAAEPIVLARKPLAEPTVAANVLAHGTGALHIDACRVGTGESVACTGQGFRSGKYGGQVGHGDTTLDGQPWHSAAGGRWPPNVAMSHHPDCRPAGVRRVKGITGTKNGSWRRGHQYSGGWAGAPPDELGAPVGYADADGYETVAAYQCAENCPVRLLDAQAGPRTGTHGGGINRQSRARRSGFGLTAGTCVPDGGSAASRFFPTFPGAEPEPEEAVPFRYEPKASRRDRGEGNDHSTVKPTALMAWLCKLATPPGGVVLDCFAGSGSTLVACVREGFGFIGIEQDSHYCDIARRRIAHARAQLAGPLFADAEKDA